MADQNLQAQPGETLAQYEARMGGIQGFTPGQSQPSQPTQTDPNSGQMPNAPAGLFGANAPTGSQFQFGNYLQTAVDRLNTINPMLQQKNLLVEQLYGQPLTPDQINTLPQPLQQAIQTGNRDQVELQLRLLNDQIAGRTNTINQSVNFLSNLYQTTLSDAETQKQQAITNVLNYSKALNQKPSVVMKALYPNIASDLGTQLDSLAAPLLTSTQVAPISNSNIFIPTGTIASQTNNPLNIKYDPNNGLGSTDSGITAQDGGTFASFSTPQDGLNAAVQLLQSPTYQNLTVEQAMRLWSNNGYGAEVSDIPGTTPMSSLTQDQLQQLVTDMATKESGSSIQFGGTTFTGTPPDPTDPKSNQVDPTTGITPNGMYNAAIEYAMTGKMPSLGLGSAAQVRLQRTAIINTAGAIATALGATFPQLQALYKSNQAAATQNVERLARVESVAQAMTLNFPRLEQLADQVNQAGIQITESDLSATQADIQRRFGGTAAAGYIELLQTMRSDYAATQAALSGSRGGQFFAANAQDAIPLGLTSDQYENIKSQILLSSKNATTAINGEVQNLIGVSGGITSPTTNSSSSTQGQWVSSSGKTFTLPNQ